MSQYTTPNFGISYADDLEPLANYAAITQQVAQTVDAALTRGGVAAPNAADLTAVAGRVSSLEASRTTDEANIAANAATASSNTSRITALETPGTWQSPSLAAGFTQLGGVWMPVRYRKEGYNLRLQGALSAGPAATVMFTLPAGFRPPNGQVLTVHTGNTSVTWLDIEPDGTVKLTSAVPGGVYGIWNGTVTLT